MVIKIATALNSLKKSINGSKIFFLGIAYKPNIDDARESPALEIMDLVEKKGGIVTYNDPYIPLVKTNHGNIYNCVDLTKETLQNADCVVITTNHSVFNTEIIKINAKLIVDMRNVIQEKCDNVFKL
jgi:UDP-N-acetyl-D-glucosamine dehydrogenase